MKYLKMFGLAAITAAAVMAFVGAGTASATGRLCSTATNPCTSPWTVPQEIDFSLKSGTSAKLTTTSGETLDTCTTSTVRGDLEKNTTTPEGPLTEIHWTGCTVTTDTIKTGRLDITATSNGNGTLFAGATIEVTVSIFGTTCNYGVNSGTSLGTVTEGIGTAATFTANAIAKKLAGNFLCPETTRWDAEYVLTKPSNTTLYVSTS
jgi:hypothetical protein